MAVLLNTSLGNFVIDLYTEQCPLTTKNFLKLCKIKYYNNCLFHSVQKDFLVQTGDPTGTGSGGDSIYKFLYGEQARFFNDEIHQNLKHDKVGVVAMASAGENLNASQFYITTRAELDYLDGKHTVFGFVAEGEDILMKINEAFVDEKNRPYKNIRIKHTYVLGDPFEDPVQLAELIPENSPVLPPPAEGEEVRLEDDWVPLDEQMDPGELDKSLRRKEAHSRAVVLEMIGDIPDAEVAPPENVLFVCKLNPVTQDEDLETIFSRFGKIVSADIIRDYKTGDSLCYAFIEFETQEACEAAYFKMDNVLIDDRRIHVDFSQSVSRLWTRYRRFGKRDMDDGKGSSFAPRANGTGCFKCGASGHFAKDCPGENEGKPTERPKYEVKSTEGQRGGAGKRYDMVFEDTSDGENEQFRQRHKNSKEEERNSSYSSRAARQEKDDESRSYRHQSKESKRYRQSDNREGHQGKDSKKYDESDEIDDRADRRLPSSSWHTESKDGVDEMRSDRNRGHRDRHVTGSDWRMSQKDGSPEDHNRGGHRDRHEAGSDRRANRKDSSPEEHYESRRHNLSNARKRDRESFREDHYPRSHKDRRETSGSRNRHREASPRDGHVRDTQRTHDKHRR